jgi:hypothetical protein
MHAIVADGWALAWKSCRQLPWQAPTPPPACPNIDSIILIKINVSNPEEKLDYQKLNSNKLYETQGEK